MAQHDYSIANGSGGSVRSDINNALAAIVSQNSGANEPATMYAYQWWADTTTGLLKIRNAANNGWVTVGTLASANLGLLASAGTLTAALGSASTPGITFTGDTNTGIYSPGADQLAIATGGTIRILVDANGNATINAQGDLRFADSDSSNWVGFQAPATVTSNVTWTLPSADGTNGQALTTNGSGTLSWLPTTAFPAGTAMLFAQTSAPTGWTKSLTHNNKALRVVTGTASSGGTTAFTSVFTSRTPSGSVSVSGSNSGGSVSNTTLTVSEIPSHQHVQGHADESGIGSSYGSNNLGVQYGARPAFAYSNPLPNPFTSPVGGGGAHSHGFTNSTWSGSASFSGSALDFAVQYVDVIIATKD